MDAPVTPQTAAVGRMIKAVRTGLGLTQDEFAAMVGTTAGTLSRFESGQRTVSPKLLDNVAQVVGQALADRTRGAA